MLDGYDLDAGKRKEQGLPPLPLTEEQTRQLTGLLVQKDEKDPLLLDLLCNWVEPGVTKSARVKAAWLKEVALGESHCVQLSSEEAVHQLSRMGGGYNVETLIDLLSVKALAPFCADALKTLIKVYDGFGRVAELARTNEYAREIVVSWAKAEWFTKAARLREESIYKVYKVEGEINTDDFSPGNQAQSRADIPLHATFFGVTRFPDGIEKIEQFKEQGHSVAFAGDVVGTGSSRKSAVNSLLWHVGADMDGVPNKRVGGIVLGGIIAPIFYATARDAGVLPIECEVEKICTGDTIILNVAKWSLTNQDGQEIPLKAASPILLDEYRAGGRLNLIIGKQLTRTACEFLGESFPAIFTEIENPQPGENQAYTLAQKMVGRACGLEGVLPGTVCEPEMTTVGSQDTTGPMTVQEINELACLRFKADLYMQSFCHTAAYPKASDIGRWETMRETAVACGGVSLKPGDGVIHSWINKMLVPDTVGTGGDSHTRFPLGISFPAGSGLVAFAAALGFMPLEMPDSVLVRFTGKRRPGISVRDMVNAIPYVAIQKGLLTVEKKGKKNVFAGTVLEIEGVDDLSVEEAFELSDASAERSAAACVLALSMGKVVANVKENLEVLRSLVEDGYLDRECLEKRIAALEFWLGNPALLQRDEKAEYKEIIEIDLSGITEPIVACPNDPDDVRLLSEVAGTTIDEAFIGSCMTHLSHLRSAARIVTDEKYARARLWVAPATRIDRDIIQKEGALAAFAQVGGRVEIPGCSLCMGNQARVRPGATVLSTSTRNFDNRLGDGTRVFLGSTELTAITALKGALPTPEEYFDFLEKKVE